MIQKENMIEALELSSTVESLSKIEQLIESVCGEYSVGEDFYGNILIALTEAVNNAITHGNHLDPNKKVSLELTKTQKEIAFTIKDEGNGFDFDNIPDPTLPENLKSVSGRGVFLMKALADDVVFEENGTKIQLKFNVSVT